MSWLYDEVLSEREDLEPLFAQQSTVNWMHALRHEINGEHGSCPKEQFHACRSALGASKRTDPAPPLASVFEPLFRGITNSMTLDRLSQREAEIAWVRPSAIVTWYYSLYACTRSMFATVGQSVGDNHSAAIKAYATVLRPQLPHPLNMRAQHRRGEIYDIRLPKYPDASVSKLAVNFAPKRDVARGMLLSYLSGTAKWYVERTKDQILQKKQVKNFRTKEAREIRDRRLEREVGFLHCAFRYRGKANYRDAIYLTYGHQEPPSMSTFVEALAETAKYFVVLALAFAEHYLEVTHVRKFLEDLHRNLRNVSIASRSERYWEDLFD